MRWTVIQRLVDVGDILFFSLWLVSVVSAVTQMSTRWRRCSNSTWGSFLNLWCPGLSTRTFWTAPTCWIQTPKRFVHFYQKHIWVSVKRKFFYLFYFFIRRKLVLQHVICVFLTGLGEAGETNCSSAQTQLQPSWLRLSVSRNYKFVRRILLNLKNLTDSCMELKNWKQM